MRRAKTVAARRLDHFALLASEEINKSNSRNGNLIEMKTSDRGLEVKCSNVRSESFLGKTMTHDTVQWVQIRCFIIER